MSDDTPEKENPMLKQVGGSHYMYMEIQPAEFINKNKLPIASVVTHAQYCLLQILVSEHISGKCDR